MSTRKELEAVVEQCTQALLEANIQLAKFDDLAENNVFATLEEAECKINELLDNRASADCEGSYNCGNDEYRQEFIVNNVKYVGIATYEYNRHDKTYYYIDQSDFRVEEL